MKKGVAIVQAKYLDHEEAFLPPPRYGAVVMIHSLCSYTSSGSTNHGHISFTNRSIYLALFCCSPFLDIVLMSSVWLCVCSNSVHLYLIQYPTEREYRPVDGRAEAGCLCYSLRRP